jgi:hypothetical protein
MMEKELQEIKAENDVLFDEVVTLKSKGIKSRIDDEYVRDIRQLRRPEGVSNVRYNISDSRIQEPVNNELKMDLGQEDMYFSDEEVPGTVYHPDLQDYSPSAAGDNHTSCSLRPFCL